jgi:hypothetical protein
MSDFDEIPIDNVIARAQTTFKGYCDKQYIIYLNLESSGNKIRINTYYLEKNDKIMLCKYYDRGLCNTMEEYYNLDISYIESQAYGSWMDGAR